MQITLSLKLFSAMLITKPMKKNNMTYRNSCLAVLVGDVGKSSSLQMKIQEEAGNKKEADKHSCINQLQHDRSSGKFSYFPLLQFSFKEPFKLLF